jgi:uncharacterized surface protein with fasciclin (FAS1) repeats
MNQHILRLTTAFLALALLFAALAPAGTAQANKADDPTILEIALSVNQSTGEFSTLIAALQAAGLAETFAGPRHYTVFAPTDAAFAALGLNAGNIGTVPVETLTNILLYHVARGDRFSQSLAANVKPLRMLNGQIATVTAADGTVRIDNAAVIAADIDARNGVIHIIDAVLLP